MVETKIEDIEYSLKKLDELLMHVACLLDDGLVDEAKKILREITGS